MPERTPVTGKTRLILVIEVETAKGPVERYYRLNWIEGHPEVAYPAWRLTRMDSTGSVYEVGLTAHGPECSCPDFVFCRQNEERGCKHCAALRAAGLLTGKRG